MGLNTAVEATNFAARLGLETLHLSLPLSFQIGERPGKEKNFIYIAKKEDLKQLRHSGFRDIFNSGWKSGIFLLPSKKKIPDVLISGDEEGLEEILKYLSCIPTDSRGVKDPIFREIKRFLENLGKYTLKESSKTISSPEKIIKNYTSLVNSVLIYILIIQWRN